MDSASDELLGMGCAVVVVKLGIHGLRARSATDAKRLSAAAMGAASPEICRHRRNSSDSSSGGAIDGTASAAEWAGQRAAAPAFRCEVWTV